MAKRLIRKGELPKSRGPMQRFGVWNGLRVSGHFDARAEADSAVREGRLFGEVIALDGFRCVACVKFMEINSAESARFHYGYEICSRCVLRINRSVLAAGDVANAVNAVKNWRKKRTAVFGSTYDRASTLPTGPGVYALSFPLDDGTLAIYVGSSVQLQARIHSHLAEITRAFLGLAPMNILMRELERVEHELFVKRRESREFELFAVVGDVHPDLRHYSSQINRALPRDNMAQSLFAMASRAGDRLTLSILELCDESQVRVRENHWQRWFRADPRVVKLWSHDEPAVELSGRS